MERKNRILNLSNQEIKILKVALEDLKDKLSNASLMDIIEEKLGISNFNSQRYYFHKTKNLLEKITK